ncbi:MAG: phage terminase small subunit [Pseudomonadales bacterium]
MTLAKRHFTKTMAAQQAAIDIGSQVRPNASQYELMLAQLHQHKQTLKGIESIVTKCARKALFVNEYEAYLEGVLEADSGKPDDVLTTIMLWKLDAGMYSSALELGAYALQHGLQMPDQYQRSIGCIIAEEIADAALKAPEESPVARFDLEAAYELLEGVDYPDPVKAKLHKALGYALQRDELLVTALEHFKSALQLNDRAGVKKGIQAIEKAIAAKPLEPVPNESDKQPTPPPEEPTKPEANSADTVGQQDTEGEPS